MTEPDSICLRCADFVGASRFAARPACPRCGGEVHPTSDHNVVLLTNERVARDAWGTLERWVAVGLISESLAKRLFQRFRPPNLAPPHRFDVAPVVPLAQPVAPAPPPPAPDPVAPILSTTSTSKADRRSKRKRQVAVDHEPTHEPVSPEQLLTGLAAFEAIDAHVTDGNPDSQEGREGDRTIFASENIGWFLGTLLVLAGSLYGVREAWRSLDSVPRHLIVATALFAYHAAFVGLGRLLESRSATSARVLSGIGVALLPIALVPIAALGVSHPIPSIVFACLTLAFSTWTLGSAAKRFNMTGSFAFPRAMFPALVALVAIACSLSPLVVLLAPLTAAVCLWWVPWPETGKSAIGASIYTNAAIFVAIPTLLPLHGELSRSAIELSAAVIGLTLAVRSRATWILVVGLAIACVASLSGLRTLGAPNLSLVSPLRWAAAATAASSTATLLWLGIRRLPGAIHVAALLGPVSGLLVTRALLGQAGMRIEQPLLLGMSLVPAAALGTSLWFPDRSRRILVGWNVAFALVALIIAAYGQNVDDPSFWLLPGAALAITLGAHMGGLHQGGGSLHLLGGLAFLVTLRMLSPVVGPHVEKFAPWLADAPKLTNVWSSPKGLAFRELLPFIGGVVVWTAVDLFSKVDGRHPPVDLASEHVPFRTSRVLRPFGDMALLGSLAALVLVAVRVVPLVPFGVHLTAFDTRIVALKLLPLLAIGGLLIVRAIADKSRMPAFFGAIALVWAMASPMAPGNPAQRALVLSFGAFATSLVGASRTRAYGADEPAGPRYLFGRLPLFDRVRGWTAVSDGFALAALVLSLCSTMLIAVFLSQINEFDRGSAVWASLNLTCVATVVFTTRASGLFGKRGSIVAFSLIVASIVLAAVTNRLGRPLAPAVVGVRLFVVGIALALLTALFRWQGPRIGRFFHNEDVGARYSVVLRNATLALTALQVIDAILVAGSPIRGLVVTPPLLMLGPVATFGLLVWIERKEVYLHLATACLLLSAPLLSAQRNVFGPALEQLVLPAGKFFHPSEIAIQQASQGLGRTTPANLLLPWNEPQMWDRGLLGIAIGVAFLAVLSLTLRIFSSSDSTSQDTATPANQPQWSVSKALTGWPILGMFAMFGLGILHVSTASSGLLFATGVLLLVARKPRELGTSIALVAGLLLAMSMVFRTGTIDQVAVLSLGILSIVYTALPIFVRTQREAVALAVRALSALALVVAFAELNGLWQIFLPTGTLIGTLFSSRWLTDSDFGLVRLLSEPVVAVMFGLASISCFATVMAYRAVAERRLFRGLTGEQLAGSSFLSGVAASEMFLGLTLCVVAFTVLAVGIDLRASGLNLAGLNLAARHGPWLLVVGASVGAGAHLVAWMQPPGVNPVTRAAISGALLARDVLLIVALGVSFIPSQYPLVFAVPMQIAGLLLVAGIAAHAGIVQRSPIRVHLAQLSLLAIYVLLRREKPLPPELDAIAALILAFTLVGVTAVARRFSVPPVASAARTLAALLPLLAGFVLRDNSRATQALFAAATAILYSVLGWAERSRLFGSLGAAAANLALLLVLLARGFNGTEFYCAPGGLLILALAHLFSDQLSHSARTTLRIVGGLLFYAPAAFELATRLGNAQTGAYAIGFGAACLLGVLLGGLFQIRAYLALGTIFLVLDVIANLLAVGLRDHRIGFVVLSVAGISILGGMVAFTLKRDFFLTKLRALRTTLRGWD